MAIDVVLPRLNSYIAPFKKETNKNGLFPQSKFSIEKHAVVCPAGCRTMVWNHNEKTEKITFFFNKKDRGNCELKQKCTVQESRTITISEHYELLKKAREYNKTDDFKAVSYTHLRAHETRHDLVC